MKKSIVFLLVTVLMLYAAGGSALSATLSPEELGIGKNAALPDELRENFLDVRAGTAMPVTEDIVVIKDGVFTITSSGVTATIEMPFGWMGFTQDLKAQLNDYLNTFKEPRKVVEYLISEGISLIAFDTASEAQIVVFFEIDAASNLFMDLQDPSMFELAVGMYQSNASEGNEVSGVVMSDRNYVRSLNVWQDGSSLAYITILNGVKAGFELYPQDKKVTDGETEALEALVETTILE